MSIGEMETHVAQDGGGPTRNGTEMDALGYSQDAIMRDLDTTQMEWLSDARPSTAAQRFQIANIASKKDPNIEESLGGDDDTASEASHVETMPPLEEFVEPAGDDDYAPKARKKRSKPRAPRRPRPSARHGHDSESDGDLITDLERNAHLDAYFAGTAPRTDQYGEPVYCICRKDDMGKWMIGCDGCDEWYHGECIRISKTDEALIDQYYCPRCQRNDVGHTTWKKKCRMVGCRKPVEQQQEAEDGATKNDARQSTKYCSHEHGLTYFKLRLNQALLTKAQIASLVKCSATRADFCRLGDNAPAVEGVAFTEKEQQRLEETRQERQRITESLAKVARRQQLMSMMREKATRVNADLKARKEKEQCGLDVRLLMQEEELDALIAEKGTELEEQMRGTTTDEMCTIPVKKCVKHAGWHQIHSNGATLQEQLLKARLDALRGEDEAVRKSAQRRL